MLKLENPALISLHISDMLLTALGQVENFLPSIREMVFPGAVPFGLVLPPWITVASAFVRPVPDLLSSTTGQHFGITSGTTTQSAGRGLYPSFI